MGVFGSETFRGWEDGAFMPRTPQLPATGPEVEITTENTHPNTEAALVHEEDVITDAMQRWGDVRVNLLA